MACFDLIDLARVALPNRKAIFLMSLLHFIHVALELRLHGFTMEPGPSWVCRVGTRARSRIHLIWTCTYPCCASV